MHYTAEGLSRLITDVLTYLLEEQMKWDSKSNQAVAYAVMT